MRAIFFIFIASLFAGSAVKADYESFSITLDNMSNNGCMMNQISIERSNGIYSAKYTCKLLDSRGLSEEDRAKLTQTLAENVDLQAIIDGYGDLIPETRYQEFKSFVCKVPAIFRSPAAAYKRVCDEFRIILKSSPNSDGSQSTGFVPPEMNLGPKKDDISELNRNSVQHLPVDALIQGNQTPESSNVLTGVNGEKYQIERIQADHFNLQVVWPNDASPSSLPNIDIPTLISSVTPDRLNESDRDKFYQYVCDAPMTPADIEACANLKKVIRPVDKDKKSDQELLKKVEVEEKEKTPSVVEAHIDPNEYAEGYQLPHELVFNFDKGKTKIRVTHLYGDDFFAIKERYNADGTSEGPGSVLLSSGDTPGSAGPKALLAILTENGVDAKLAEKSVQQFSCELLEGFGQRQKLGYPDVSGVSKVTGQSVEGGDTLQNACAKETSYSLSNSSVSGTPEQSADVPTKEVEPEESEISPPPKKHRRAHKHKKRHRSSPQKKSPPNNNGLERSKAPRSSNSSRSI